MQEFNTKIFKTIYCQTFQRFIILNTYRFNISSLRGSCQSNLAHFNKLLLIFILSFSLFSCKEETIDFDANSCKMQPPFLTALGFNPELSFFSTSSEKTMGLIVFQNNQSGTVQSPAIKQYQHPSWKQAGWLGPILIDNTGNIFTAPAPFVNILNNPSGNQNTIYKVDANTGIMETFLKLPLPDSTDFLHNPYGILGMSFLCENNILFVSTIAGSNRQHERGAIYAIDIINKKIIDSLFGYDAMGIGISYIEGKRKLYFGHARDGDIFSISLTAKGKFAGKVNTAFSLEGIGPRGDDKAKKISSDKTGNLIVAGKEFSFNLIAASEKQETIYTFKFDDIALKWMQVN